MSSERRPLSVADIQNRLSKDRSGNLYWDGKRVRTTNWGTAEWALVVAALTPVILLLANLTAIRDTLGFSELPPDGGHTPINVEAPR